MYSLITLTFGSSCPLCHTSWCLAAHDFLSQAGKFCICRYSPDALDYLPPNKDMVLMNFYGRYTPINDMVYTNTTSADRAADDCCVRFNTMTCQPASPAVGFLDLGGVIFNMPRFSREKRKFMSFEGACPQHSCHDGALTDTLFKEGWSYVTHPLDVCALHHNSNFQSCAMLGGVYYDSNDFYQAKCYELTKLPLEHKNINFGAFVQSQRACICPVATYRQDHPMEHPQISIWRR